MDFITEMQLFFLDNFGRYLAGCCLIGWIEFFLVEMAKEVNADPLEMIKYYMQHYTKKYDFILADIKPLKMPLLQGQSKQIFDNLQKTLFHFKEKQPVA